jgi:hypothetical protein
MRCGVSIAAIASAASSQIPIARAFLEAARRRYRFAIGTRQRSLFAIRTGGLHVCANDRSMECSVW